MNQAEKNQEKANEFLKQVTQIRDELNSFLEKEEPILLKLFPDADVSNGSEEEKKRASIFLNVSESKSHLDLAIYELNLINS